MKLVSSLALGLALVAAPLSAQTWSKEQTEVWKFVSDAWASHADSDTWHTVLDDSGFGWGNRWPVPTSKAEMKRRADVFGKEGEVLYYRLDPLQITVSGDTAIAYYYAGITETDHKGERENSREMCADTLVKRGGQWRFLGWNCFSKSDGEG
ncbi:nuclear transport factor 2 family protein [Qipengyuania sphaerica]|uniref:nuclear transport factor 2 family protein n=1 Tax=Qipengyuania sphaerica TaxID=2867243 RepID=UPI001C87E56C|nr:DUF4440 domain-containing protein [Qipengyuania sphaerica]MBX7541031.1 nuclear transport factor 2 family protein [Qipengyuania sphaerica]